MTTWMLVLFVAPLAWSLAAWAWRRLTHNSTASDAAEKRFLLLLLAPLLIGAVMPFAGHMVKLPAALQIPVAAAPAVVAGGRGGGEFMLEAPASGIDIMTWLMAGLVALYVAVAAIRLVRTAVDYVRLAIAAHRARPAREWGRDVHLSPDTLPPLAWGRNRVVLPHDLIGTLSRAEIAMIVSHERAHLRRGDPLWFAVLSLIDAVLWFNPVVRNQTKRCRLAAELDCDAAVTAAEPDMRGTYAESLVKVLKHAAGSVRPYAPAAFSPVQSGDYRMRITRIMQPSTAPRKPWRLAYAAAAVLVAAIGAVQLAWSQEQASAPQDFSLLPVDAPVSDGFGVRTKPVGGQMKFHSGVDFAVPTGTPVRAVAGGVVSRVEADKGYGKLIEIDDGGGFKTRYAHLDSQAVHPGQTIAAGQEIATTGSTGISTGPHLHLEIWLDERPINPMTILLHTDPLILADAINADANGKTVATGKAVIRLGSQTWRGERLTYDPATKSVTSGK